MDVELRHLRAFAAVAAARSFTRAAEQLHITQPALTRTIKQLETTLRVSLIDRTSHPISLTPAGQRFLPYTTRVLNCVAAGINAARQDITIRLGFSWLLPDPWAQDTVLEFENITGATVRLIRCDDPLAALRDGRIDAALVRGANPGLEQRRLVHLYDETRVAVCSHNSPLAENAELDWNAIPHHAIVVNTLTGTTGPWSWPEHNQPREVIETTNFDEWLETIAAGRGIGVVPDIAQHRNIHPALSYIPIRNAPPSPVWLALRAESPDAPLQHFVQAARNAARASASSNA